MPKIVDHDEQRLQLSATVAAVIADAGLEHTTLRTVAAHHGCTKGMVQHYFGDKDELLLAALGYIEAQRVAREPEPKAGATSLAQLHALCLSHLPLTPVLQEEWRVRLAFMGLASQSVTIARFLAECRARERSEMQRLLRQAQRTRALRAGVSPPGAYRSLAALVNGLGACAVADPGEWGAKTQRQLLKAAVDDLRR